MVNLHKQDRPENYPILPIRSPRIIVVDNDHVLCDGLSDAFIELGFQHRIYPQVDNMMPIVEDFTPDLVLMEYLLPTLNGGELCNQLRMNQHTCQIPVIMYSSFPKALLSLASCSCDAFLQKPFSINSLLRTMNCFLKCCSHLRSSNALLSSVSDFN